jgi:hypothetical protein
MTNEPINVFAREADPAGVARRLRELDPSVKLDGPDDDWRTATVTFGRLWMKRRLTFIYDPAYHAEPSWSQQMNGMRGYFQRFPESPRKQMAVMIPTTFRYSLATRFEPEHASDSDPRLAAVMAVAEHLDGVIFTPSALRDARGRVLFGAGGEASEDADATWPRVVAQVNVSATDEGDESEDDDEPAPEPPSAERVARRALALAAVTARAMMEYEASSDGAPHWHRKLLGWVGEIGIGDELEPAERAVLDAPPGALDPQTHASSTWRLEGLAVLAWALGRFDLPRYDEQVEPNPLWESLGLLGVEEARALMASATLRPREEIGALRGRLFAVHWRLRDYSIRPQAMDFAEFARTCWFGPLDITGLALADGDVALQGERLDRADPEALTGTSSIAHERHLALNWLCEGPALYSDASVAT